jgi:hypothetical protein
MNIEFKQVSGDTSLSSEGTAIARIATLGVPDLDGDVVLPGAIGRQTALVLQAHQQQGVPLGKASVREQGDAAIARILFNMAIPQARDLHSSILFDLKNPPPKQEWSFAFTVNPGGARFGDWNGSRVRFLQPLVGGEPGVNLLEVSTVMKGASIGTATLGVKRMGGAVDRLYRDFCETNARIVAAESERIMERIEKQQANEEAELLCAEFEGRLVREYYDGASEKAALARDVLPQLRRVLGIEIELRWFTKARASWATNWRVFEIEPTTAGFARHDEAPEIWIRDDVSEDELVGVLAHEARHRQQFDHPASIWKDATHEAREADAQRFAARFVEARRTGEWELLR